MGENKLRETKQTELRIQQECFMWFWNNYPKMRWLFFKVKNENGGVSASYVINQLMLFLKTMKINIVKDLIFYCKKSGSVSGAIDKATGLIPGVSDMIMILPNGKAVFFEFKTPTGTQSQAQKKFESNVKICTCDYYLIRSIEDFKQIILYINNKVVSLG